MLSIEVFAPSRNEIVLPVKFEIVPIRMFAAARLAVAALGVTPRGAAESGVRLTAVGFTSFATGTCDPEMGALPGADAAGPMGIVFPGIRVVPPGEGTLVDPPIGVCKILGAATTGEPVLLMPGPAPTRTGLDGVFGKAMPAVVPPAVPVVPGRIVPAAAFGCALTAAPMPPPVV